MKQFEIVEAAHENDAPWFFPKSMGGDALTG